MKYPSRPLFRTLAWLGVVAITAQAYWYVVASPLSAESAFSWMYYGAVIPERLLPPIWNCVWASYILLSALFALGFSWARWLLLCNLILSTLLNLVSGIFVMSASDAFLGSASSLLLWFPFVLSFFEPCSTYFSWKGPFGAGKGGAPNRASNAQRTGPANLASLGG
jgi:hypothetical protein